jgi:hypothetical protein
MLAVALGGMRAGIEPFATWFYPFAWYSTLLVIEAAVARRDGRFFLLDRPAFALSLFGWSIPFWLFFELLNFRLANWYYVFVPDGAVARWTGIAISFATVLPAIFLAERALRAYGPWREVAAADEPEWRTASEPAAGPLLGTRALLVLQILGFACLVLPLVWPGTLFPLVWVGATLIADPWVYRRDPRRSLLRDLETGRPRRPIRLVVGGMAIGLLWETFNFSARGKWIYTVPGLEELKLFEMPVLGFFGFPFLALEGWSVYQALVVAGLAVDPGKPAPDPHGEIGARPVRPGWTLLAAALATVFSVLVLRGMERATISSTTPRLEDLDGPPAAELRARGLDVFELADAEPDELSERIGASPEQARAWIDEARLVTLRGIGAANADRLRAAGVDSVRELAGQNPEALAARLAATGHVVSEARVRVWVRAAVEAVREAS